MQLCLPNPLKPVVNSRMRCSWSSADRRCSNYIWVINNLTAYYSAYIRFESIGQWLCSNQNPGNQCFPDLSASHIQHEYHHVLIYIIQILFCLLPDGAQLYFFLGDANFCQYSLNLYLKTFHTRSQTKHFAQNPIINQQIIWNYSKGVLSVSFDLKLSNNLPHLWPDPWCHK